MDAAEAVPHLDELYLWSMQMTPTRALVSVIIPTYNRAHCLARAVESALTQTYPNVEVIVVDDGSTDTTGDLIVRQYGKDRRVMYLYQANSGVCAARNAGFERARGDYIALLDSDDVWEPWKLELQIACLEKHPEIGMVWTDMTAIGRDGTTVISRAYMRQMYSAYRWYTNETLFSARHTLDGITPAVASLIPGASLWTGDIFSQIIVGNLVTTPTVVLTRKRLAAVGGFDQDLAESGEDHDFHLRTCREGAVGFVDVSSTRVQRGRDDQLSSKQLPLARNYLITVSRALARDRERITLPQNRIDGVMAHAHRWIGEALLAEGLRKSEARKHLYQSLSWAIDRRTLFAIALSFVPASLRNIVRVMRRRMRESFATRM